MKAWKEAVNALRRRRCRMMAAMSKAATRRLSWRKYLCVLLCSEGARRRRSKRPLS